MGFFITGIKYYSLIFNTLDTMLMFREEVSTVDLMEALTDSGAFEFKSKTPEQSLSGCLTRFRAVAYPEIAPKDKQTRQTKIIFYLKEGGQNRFYYRKVGQKAIEWKTAKRPRGPRVQIEEKKMEPEDQQCISKLKRMKITDEKMTISEEEMKQLDTTPLTGAQVDAILEGLDRHGITDCDEAVDYALATLFRLQEGEKN
jgi:hypothetical protein